MEMEISANDLAEYLNYVNREIDQVNYQNVEGIYYLDVIKTFHENLQPKTYLEIGIATGDCLKLSTADRSIGVDPFPQLQGDFSSHLMYLKTSDDFFQEDAPELFAEEKIDLAFIDGLHLFEFAFRDFINTEKYAHPNGYILIHDVLPRSFSEASRGRVTGAWTGDVWRVILALRKYRPDLNITVLDAVPTGIGIISGIDPNSDVLSSNYEDIVAEFMNVNTLSFLKARDLIMHSYSTELYLTNLILSHALES
jgi:hypothetical protein